MRKTFVMSEKLLKFILEGREGTAQARYLV